MPSSTFKLKVNDREEFSLAREEAERLDSIRTDPNGHHVLLDNQSFRARIVHEDFPNRTCEIRIGANTYRVDIETGLDRLIESMGYRLGSAQAENTVKAPMPGIILEIRVKTGDPVKKGDALLILEAMKMENAILSPKDGVIKNVLPETGETVDKNKLLIELE